MSAFWLASNVDVREMPLVFTNVTIGSISATTKAPARMKGTLPLGDMCSALLLISMVKSSAAMWRKAWTARQEALSGSRICSTWFSGDNYLDFPFVFFPQKCFSPQKKFLYLGNIFVYSHLIRLKELDVARPRLHCTNLQRSVNQGLINSKIIKLVTLIEPLMPVSHSSVENTSISIF